MGVEIIVLNVGSFCFGWLFHNDEDYLVDIYLGFIAISIAKRDMPY